MVVFDMKVDAVFLCCLIPSINYRRPILRTNNPLALATPGTQRKGNFLKEIWRYTKKKKSSYPACPSSQKSTPRFSTTFWKMVPAFYGPWNEIHLCFDLGVVSPTKKRSKKDFFKDLFHLPDQRPSTQRRAPFRGSFCGLSFFTRTRKLDNKWRQLSLRPETSRGPSILLKIDWKMSHNFIFGKTFVKSLRISDIYRVLIANLTTFFYETVSGDFPTLWPA